MDWVKVLAEHGPWAVVAACFVAIVFLHLEVKASHAREITTIERVIPLVAELLRYLQRREPRRGEGP